MTLRPTQASTYDLVTQGLRTNLSRLVNAQEKVASGKRILRPSDDPTGASILLALKRQKARVDGWSRSVADAQPVVSSAASRLQEGSDLVAEARSLLVQAMNGTLAQADRDVIASQLEELAAGMVEIGNSRYGNRYLFGGTAVERQPFELEGSASGRHAVYNGNHERPVNQVGPDAKVEIGLAGDDVFGGTRYERTRYDGLTGVRAGSDADHGVGYANLTLRTDSVAGVPPGGITLQPGATILGSHTLVVDAAANTVQLGNGPALAVPTPLPSSFVVTDEDGSQVVLDLSAWNGSGGSTNLDGSGSITLDGVNWVVIDPSETNLELQDAERGNVLHLDLTQVTRAGAELVTFEGATNLVDTLLGVAHDLRNDQGLSVGQLTDRLGIRLEQLDTDHESLLMGMVELGARLTRLDRAENQLTDLSLQVESLRSEVEDADLADAVLEMSRAEQTLQVAQATGARLLQRSLLDYLR